MTGNFGGGGKYSQILRRQFEIGTVLEADLEYTRHAMEVQFGWGGGVHTAILDRRVSGRKQSALR
jgi:hypothetical protein